MTFFTWAKKKQRTISGFVQKAQNLHSKKEQKYAFYFMKILIAFIISTIVRF